MNTTIRKSLLLASAGFAITVSGAVQAQGAGDGQRVSPSSAVTETGDIIVTARRVGESVQKVPLAVTALTTKDLQAKAVLDVNDLQKVVPSLNTLQQATGAAGLFFNLRGLIQTDTAAFQPGSVGIYQDDVYIGGAGIAGQLLDINDLNTVEVLKGPQGTLYGRNVTGGVVKFVTAKPSDQFEGYVKAGYGNYDRKSAEGMINIPLASNVALRLNGSIIDRDGYSYDVVNRRDLENDHHWNIRGALKADLAPNFHVLVQGSYGEYRGHGADDRTIYVDPTNVPALGNFIAAQGVNGLTAANLAPIVFFGAAVQAGTATPGQVAAFTTALGQFGAAAPTALGLLNQYANASRDNARQYPGLQTGDKARLALGALTLAYDLSDQITLKSITAYNFARRESFYTVGGDAYTYIYSKQPGENSQWSQEFNLVGKALDDRLTFAGGLFLLDQKIKDDRNPGTIDGVFPYFLGQRGLRITNRSSSVNRIHVQSLAPYFQGSYEIVPDIHVTGGLRYTKEKFSLTTTDITVAGVCNSPAPTTSATPLSQCSASSHKSFNNLSYTYGADWTVTPGVMLYVRSGKGFKSGGVSPFINAGAPFTFYQPESNTDYEIGIKSEFLNQLIRFNADYYHTNYKDIQRTLTVRPQGGNPATGVFNAATAKIDGVEAELNVRPVRSFNLGGTLAWTRAKYNSFVIANSNFPGGTQNLSYLPFYTLPKWQYSLYANYEHPAPWGMVRAGVNWSHKSGTLVGQPDSVGTPGAPVAPGGPGSSNPSYTANPLYQRPFGLLGASLAFDIDAYKTTLSFWGRNILDKRYKESGTCLVALGLGSCWAAYGAPATYGVDVTVRF